jgi:RNA polymerase sigma factor (sigma-70 family)
VKRGANLDELEALYGERLVQFRRVATGITGDVETGADAVNDAFVGCVRGRAGFRGVGRLEAWVWRAVVTSALKIVRDRREVVLGSVNPPAPDGGVSSERDRVRDAVRNLPERERLILFLTYYADLDYATIAEALKIKPGTVGAALHEARRKLRAELEEVVQR